METTNYFFAFEEKKSILKVLISWYFTHSKYSYFTNKTNSRKKNVTFTISIFILPYNLQKFYSHNNN